ncbi:MAG: hypothetical protein IJ558_02540 [Treponema sp.]|nr:hypothetical protein [Treponema sp.]
MSKTDFKRENLEYKINDMIATGKFEITDLLEELLRISIKDYELGKLPNTRFFDSHRIADSQQYF